MSLNLRVFGPCLLQNWNVGVGIFPIGEKVLVSGVGLGTVALHRIGAGEAKISKRSDGLVEDNAGQLRILANSAAASAPWPAAK